MRSGEVIAAAMWDTGGWTLNRENPDIQFIVPRSGALGWLDTFALPARGRNDAAAYAWINFTMRPDVAARITAIVGNWTAARGTETLVDPRCARSTTPASPRAPSKTSTGIRRFRPGSRRLEGRILDRIKAAN